MALLFLPVLRREPLQPQCNIRRRTEIKSADETHPTALRHQAVAVFWRQRALRSLILTPSKDSMEWLKLHDKQSCCGKTNDASISRLRHLYIDLLKNPEWTSHQGQRLVCVLPPVAFTLSSFHQGMSLMLFMNALPIYPTRKFPPPRPSLLFFLFYFPSDVSPHVLFLTSMSFFFHPETLLSLLLF